MSDMITWVGTISSVLGILVPVIIWYSSIDKKLDKIIYQNNTLDLQQAEAIVAMYLAMTRHDLTVAISRFFEKEFSDHDLRHGGAVDEFFYREAPDIIRNSRTKLQPFRLCNNVTVQQFLNENNPIEAGIIADAIENVVKVVKSGIINHDGNDELKTQVYHTVQIASLRSMEKLTRDLKTAYGVSSLFINAGS
jgi:hypothetical protein